MVVAKSYTGEQLRGDVEEVLYAVVVVVAAGGMFREWKMVQIRRARNGVLRMDGDVAVVAVVVVGNDTSIYGG